MVRRERNSLLVIRAWIENDAEAGGFRARLTRVPDASTPDAAGRRARPWAGGPEGLLALRMALDLRRQPVLQQRR